MKLLNIIICGCYLIIFHYKLSFAMPPLRRPLGDGSLHGLQQQAQFGEGVRDWFVNMKDRIFGNSASPNLSTLVIQAHEDYQHQKKMIEGFWLDLTHISIDPERDWGFHVGPWLIIKRFNDDSDSVINAPQSRIPYSPPETNWVHYNFDKDKSTTESIPVVINNTNDLETSTQVTQIIEDNSVFENDINEKDNDTYNHYTIDQSSQVILPKN